MQIFFFSTEIISGDLTILELVGSLGSHLTSTDEEKRRQGVLLLVNIIKNLPANHLNENEVYVLSQFFCDRLKDRLTIIPAALMGLESIVGIFYYESNKLCLIYSLMALLFLLLVPNGECKR